MITKCPTHFSEENKAPEGSSKSPKQPKLLEFKVSSEVNNMIEDAKKNLDKLVVAFFLIFHMIHVPVEKYHLSQIHHHKYKYGGFIDLTY